MCQSKNGGAGRVRTSQPNPCASGPSPEPSRCVTRRPKAPWLHLWAGRWGPSSHRDSLQGIPPGVAHLSPLPFLSGAPGTSPAASPPAAPAAPSLLRLRVPLLTGSNPSLLHFCRFQRLLRHGGWGQGWDKTHKKQRTDPSGGNRRVVVKVATAHLFSQK